MVMERLKRSVVFWVLLLVSVALPVAAQKTIKKQLYHANISIGSSGVGSSTILFSQSNPFYLVRTTNLPNYTVVRVSLVSDEGTWPGEIVLCENGTQAGDCTYDETGNHDLEGYVVAPMFPIGLSGGDFVEALRGGHLTVKLNGGTAGVGTYVRII
jgi:hypothetical protein